MKNPVDVAVKAWADAQFKRSLGKKLRNQRLEFDIKDFEGFGLAASYQPDYRRVVSPLAAAQLFEVMATDENHLFRANALHSQAEFLRHAADDAYAEGWSQHKVEELRAQSRLKNELGFEVALEKRSLIVAKGLEDWDRLHYGSLTVQSSCAWSLVWWNLQHGEIDMARNWFSKLAAPGSGTTSTDLYNLENAFTSATMYGPGAPQQIEASAVAGRPWWPNILGEESQEGLVYAEIRGSGEEVSLNLWRWPVVDGAGRLQWAEEEKDWHHIDIEPASFWWATGQLNPRPTSNSILALRLKGDFPILERTDPTYEFAAIFTEVVAEVTREVHAKSLETVRSVERDELSA